MKRTLYIAIVLILLVVGIVTLIRYFTKVNRPVIQGVVECRSYRASSKLAGRIDSMYVTEGNMVYEGELLYTISTPELDAKLQQVNALKAEAEAINSEVDMGARKEQVVAIKSLWHKALAGLELAEASYERVKNLYDRGVVPRQQYDEALANYQAMQATVEATKAEYELVLEGATRQQREAVEAKVREAQGGVDEVRSYLKDAEVHAPISGRVSSVMAESGELVGTGTPVVTILDIAHCWVTFNIKEDKMADIHLGYRFEAYIPALDRRGEFEVYYIASEANYATWGATRARGGFDIRSFEVRARSVEHLDILPGMSVIVYGDRL